ncbi:uncharacterized protein [Pyrus communis]|uniref:uncharacterized protein n=1 Tax=Pyrus communis TaxID=23211 RepID=UPI0035C0244E
MAYRMHTDEERCLLFPSTLSGGALNWYCRLSPETIDSFEELRKLFVSQHIFQTDHLHSADDLYTIRQKPDESLQKYTDRFSHEYSRCAKADDMTALKAFTAGLRDCFFKYMINANTCKTYSEVMAQAYNHASTEARTYQGKLLTAIPDQQMGSGSQIQPNEKTSTFQTAATLPPALPNTSPSQHAYHSQGKRKDFHPHKLILIKRVRGTTKVFHVEDIRGGKYQKPNWDPICFYPEEERGIIYPHNDPLIVKVHIANFEVRRILVDTGASLNIMFAEAFKTLNVAEHLLDHSVSPCISFSGDVVQPLGSVHLPFTISTCMYTATITTNFLVVDCPTTYNVIFGRTCINDLKAMVSIHMLLMKFPTPYGNGYIRGHQLSARSCYNTSVKQQHLHVPKETLSIHDQVIKTSSNKANLNIHNGNNQLDDPRDDSFTQQSQPAEELEKVSISKDYPDRIVKIGTTLSPPTRLTLISFLQKNTEVFAWSYEDMPGISPDIICHRLSINPKTKPVKQKRRSYDVEQYEAMKAEV